MEILEEPTGAMVGFVLKPLIEPDKGVILGFYVVPTVGEYAHKIAYISALDILHIGTRVEIKDEQQMCDPEDIVRLQPILEDARLVLGQKIRTESGEVLGRCKDVQFDTESMHITWLFPRKWFRWSIPLPIVAVLEVRKSDILVRDLQDTVPEEVHTAMSAALSEPAA